MAKKTIKKKTVANKSTKSVTTASAPVVYPAAAPLSEKIENYIISEPTTDNLLNYSIANNRFQVPVQIPYAKQVPYGQELSDDVLLRQLYAESAFNPNAVSKAGYKGLGQIGEDVIESYKKATGVKKVDPFNVNDNIAVQKWAMTNLYNAEFINRPDQDPEIRLAKTLAAYNWGRGNLSDYLSEQKKKGVDIYNSKDWINNLPKETKDYIEKILYKSNDRFNEEFKKAIGNDKYKNITERFIYDPNKVVIDDNMGQWAHPGEVTRIASNNITMQGVPYPVLGVGADGEQRMMYPNEEHTFNQAPVTEYPMMQAKHGGWLSKFQTGSVPIKIVMNDGAEKLVSPEEYKDLYDSGHIASYVQYDNGKELYRAPDDYFKAAEITAPRRYRIEGCVAGVCNDLANENKTSTEEFRKLGNLYGNAWEIVDNMYGQDIDMSKDFSNLQVGDIVNLQRERFQNDDEKGIPAQNQHVGRISKIVDGVPYIKHYISHVGTDDRGGYGQYFEEPITNISKFVHYTPTRAKRPDFYKDITTAPSTFRFDQGYSPNAIENQILNSAVNDKKNIQNVLKLNNEEYEKLARIAYGILGAESSFGRSGKTLYRMATPDFLQKSVKMTEDFLRNRDVYDDNINNLSQGYGSQKESSLHTVSDVNATNGQQDYRKVNQKVRQGDYSGLERGNNYLFYVLQEMGLNPDNLESGDASYKTVMANLAFQLKKNPNATEDELIAAFTGKKNIDKYKKNYSNYLRNIDANPNNNLSYGAWKDFLGNASSAANVSSDFLKNTNSQFVSFLRDASPLPENLNALAADILGGKEEINANTLSTATLESLKNIVRNNIAKNKYSIEYNDYGTSENSNADVGGNSSEGTMGMIKKALTDENYMLKTLLGQAQIVKVADGVYDVIDTYDFNDKGKTFGLVDDAKKRGISPYALIRSMGRNYGSQDSQGAKVKIRLDLNEKKKDGGWIKKYAEGGNISKEELEYLQSIAAEDFASNPRNAEIERQKQELQSRTKQQEQSIDKEQAKRMLLQKLKEYSGNNAEEDDDYFYHSETTTPKQVVKDNYIYVNPGDKVTRTSIQGEMPRKPVNAVDDGIFLAFADAIQEYKERYPDKPLPRISSGLRTREEQERLYANRGSNRYPVAKPGTSKHELGQALDIVFDNGGSDEDYQRLANLMSPRGFKWLGDYDKVHFEVDPNYPKTYVSDEGNVLMTAQMPSTSLDVTRPKPRAFQDGGEWQPNQEDLRADGTQKGTGYLGVLNRPDGGVSSELSMGVEIDGQEVEIPTMVPTLNPEEINYLLNTPADEDLMRTEIGRRIMDKAYNHAMMRMDQGLSPFYQEGEERQDTGVPRKQNIFNTEYKRGGVTWLNEYAQGGKVFSAGGEKHKIYRKQSPTGNGKGVKGHIMVTHPTMDKGKWDTIDLTEKSGAKTIAQGVAATKKWHRENPEYATGGPFLPGMNPLSPATLMTPKQLKQVSEVMADIISFLPGGAGVGYAAGLPFTAIDLVDDYSRAAPASETTADAVGLIPGIKYVKHLPASGLKKAATVVKDLKAVNNLINLFNLGKDMHDLTTSEKQTLPPGTMLPQVTITPKKQKGGWLNNYK